MKHFGFFDQDSGRLEAFASLTSQTLDPAEVPFAADVAKNVPVYDMVQLSGALTDAAERRALMAEWACVLGQSSGVLVLKTAFSETAPVDAATDLFNAIIAREKAETGGKADHFAAAGANDRIWNAIQKLCEADPAVFARYFGNPAIAAVCEAWLGPGYQMTAQVNLVRPGGQAQEAHRDYHLGFQSADVAARFPAHAHTLSSVMTLQGAVAHCDMPVESGPTQLLPFSQLFPEGYMAYRRAEFRAFFAAHAIQLPLEKGDAVFFNPALFHAAGENRSADILRMANLLQVSSAFGRAMESVDRLGMCKVLYPALQSLSASGELDELRVEAAIGACAEGYSFPTNLDTDPPEGGLAPETQAALMRRALEERMTPEAFAAALDAQTRRRRA
jgi:ectoine hydroxylase-related dioxygenase (phytanoyl-CoA dioxygenase family)